MGQQPAGMVTPPSGDRRPDNPADGERDFLLATKLKVPRIRPDLLARRRLIERLDEAPDRELVLVSASPGFGKSTLLAEWARNTDRPVAWVSLDPDDNDPSRFWRYVVAAVEQVHQGLEEQVVPLLRGPDQPAPEAVVRTVVNEFAARPEELALVLDDHHAIVTPAIHESLAFLLDHMPAGLRLIIAARSDPPLALALMRARGQLTELRAEDLRFTSEEAAALLLEAWALDLPAESAAALEDRTEGWVTGLQLAALSLRGTSDPVRLIAGFTGSHRYVLDYLTEQVLERQPDHVQSFLLETSILERLSGPLCDAVTARSDGQLMLENLERANLFLVALDEERRWYRYHRLFADLLRVRLQERYRERMGELHRKAAAWCDEHGLVDDAVRYAMAGGDSQSAARIVERHVGEVLGRGEGATLRRWLTALPDEVVRSRPGLCLVQAIAAMNAGHYGQAESFLDDAERSLATTTGELEPAGAGPSSTLAMITSTIASVRASIAIARGRPGQARGLATEALSLLSESNWAPRISVRWNLALADWMEGRPADAERQFAGLATEGWASGLPHMALSAGAVLGRVQRAQGRPGGSPPRIPRGARDRIRGRSPVVLTVGESHIGMAEVLYQRDQLDEALRHVGEGIELSRRLTSPQALATGLATLAWIRQASGDQVLRALRRAPRVTGSVPGRAAPDSATGLVETLTDREFEVLEMLAAGKSNREIADEFVVTLDTVKKHVTHVLDKLGAANRTQAVAQARVLGLID